MNDSSPTLSSLRRTFGRVSKGWNDAVAVPQSFADERREMRRIVGLQEQIDRNPVAADVAAASCDTVTGRILPRVAMTTGTGRVSDNDPATAFPWEVVLAFWNRRRVSAETPACFAASFCETPFFMSFRASSSGSERLKGCGLALLGRSAALACPRACERLLPPASPRAMRIRYSLA